MAYIWSKVNKINVFNSITTVLENSNYKSLNLDIPQRHIFFATEFIKLDSFYIFVDSTFKTNREGLELFALILLYEGEGYPASYFYLDKNVKESHRKDAIRKW